MRKHIVALMEAQDHVRRAWADMNGTIVEKDLREIDRGLTKLMNQLDTMYPHKQGVNNENN